MGNYCYVAVCSAALGTSAPTDGGEGRGHIVAAARLQLVIIVLLYCRESCHMVKTTVGSIREKVVMVLESLKSL